MIFPGTEVRLTGRTCGENPRTTLKSIYIVLEHLKIQ